MITQTFKVIKAKGRCLQLVTIRDDGIPIQYSAKFTIPKRSFWEAMGIPEGFE